MAHPQKEKREEIARAGFKGFEKEARAQPPDPEATTRDAP
jgi:hypothetical protein